MQKQLILMRLLSDFEKQLVLRLRDIRNVAGIQGVCNLVSLIDPYIQDCNIIIRRQPRSANILFENNQGAQGIIESVNRVLDTIITAVNLLKLLEENGYIYSYINANQRPNPLEYGGLQQNLTNTVSHTIPSPAITKLLLQYSSQEILLTSEFDAFIERGYISREDHQFNQNYNLTRISVGISFVVGFVSIIVGYFGSYYSWKSYCSSINNTNKVVDTPNNKYLPSTKTDTPSTKSSTPIVNNKPDSSKKRTAK